MKARWSSIAIAVVILFGLPVSFALEPGAERSIDLHQMPAKVEFHAIGNPSSVRILGTVADKNPLRGTLTLDDKGLQGTAQIALDLFDTGISLRNRHLREKYLETGKYPNAKLKITALLLPGILRQTEMEAVDVPFEGVLDLHGKSKTINGLSRFTRSGDKFDMGFAFSIQTSKFGIETPKFLKLTIAEEVKINVEVKAKL